MKSLDGLACPVGGARGPEAPARVHWQWRRRGLGAANYPAGWRMSTGQSPGTCLAVS